MPTKGRSIPSTRRRTAKPANSNVGWRGHVDKAWIAAQEAQKLLPVFTSFARSMTGNKSIRVRVGTVTMTDGKTISIVPPIELGDIRTHDKAVCNKRGDEKILRCKACDARESVLFRLYHEIGHVAFNSNEHIDDYFRKQFMDLVHGWHPDGVCAHGLLIRDQIKHLSTAIQIALTFNPYLRMIINAFEDARVNASMFQARPGLSVMFDAQTAKLFSKGISIPHSGEIVKWADADLNSQVVVGLFLIASGYTVGEGYLTDDAVEVLQDPELIRICGDVEVSRNVQQVFAYAIQAWRRLQELGVCHMDKCQPAPETPEESDEPGASDSDAPSLGNDGGKGGDKANNDSGGDDDGPGGSSPGSGSAPPGKSGGHDSGGSEDVDPDGKESDSSDDSSEREDDRGGGSDTEGSAADDPDDKAGLPGDRDEGVSDGPEGSDEPEESSAARGGDGVRDTDEGVDSESSDSSDAPAEDEGDPDDASHAGSSGGSEEDSSLDAKGGDGDDSDESDSSSRTEASEGGEPSEDEDPGGESGGHEVEADPDWDGSDGGDPEDRSFYGDEWREAETESGVAEPTGMEPGDADDPVKRRQELSAESDPDLLRKLINIFNGHDVDSEPEDHRMHFGYDDGDFSPSNATDEETAVIAAVLQSDYFDRPSHNITGIDVFSAPFAESNPRLTRAMRGWGAVGTSVEEITVDNSLIAAATMQARLVFEANARGKKETSLKSGRIDGRVLGRRAALGDERLFMKRSRPQRKDYFVLIGVDCSGSTSSNGRMYRMKRLVYAQAEMLHRLGVKFAIYAHTGNVADDELVDRDGFGYGSLHLWMLEVKSPDAPWDSKTKNALAELQPLAANLDGHTLEFYRKLCDEVRAQKKIIMYYTDGKMPLENYDEEYDILLSEIETCERKGIALAGVGIDTDSPKQYGLDTCIVQSDADMPLVVEHLKAQLLR